MFILDEINTEYVIGKIWVSKMILVMIENLTSFILYEKMSMFYLNTKHLAKTRFLSTSLSKQDDFNTGY